MGPEEMKNLILVKVYNGTLMTMVCPPLGNLYMIPRGETLKDLASKYPVEKKMAYKQFAKDLKQLTPSPKSSKSTYRKFEEVLVGLPKPVSVKTNHHTETQEKTEIPTGSKQPELELQGPVLTQQQLQAHAKMRDHVVKEILTTELSYIESINLVVTYLMKPILAAAILEPNEFERVFSNLDRILENHRKICGVIQPKIEKWTPKSTIGREFYENLQMLDDYEPYLVNYNTANMCWEQLLKKYPTLPQFHHAFEEESIKHTGHKVADILIMPIQRIPRYIMLLEQLKKFAIPGTVEHKHLKASLDNIQSKLLVMNSHIDIALVPKMEMVLNARNSMINATEDIFPTSLTRTLLKEGFLKVSNADKKKWTSKKLCVFLHDDYFVLCTKKKEKKDETRKFEILEIGTSNSITGIVVLKKKEFKIMWKMEEWFFETKTDEDCCAWVVVIQSLEKDKL